MRHRQFLGAHFAPSAEKPAGRVKDLVFYSGVDVKRYDFWRDEEWILRLSMDPKDVLLERLNDGAPLLKDHTYSRPIDTQVGVIEKGWLENGNAMARARFADTPDVDDLWNKVDSGIIQNVSMEVNIGRFEDVTPKGGKTKIMLGREWMAEAIAIVPVGADPNAGFLSADNIATFYGVPVELLNEIKREFGAANSRITELMQSLATTGATGAAEKREDFRAQIKRARLRLLS